MTDSIKPGTPVTVVLTGVYTGFWPTDEDGPDRHHFATEDAEGRVSVYDFPANASVAPADGPDPVVLTPALRSLAHRAARDLPPHSTPAEAVEAALSALEPVVAGLVEQARKEGPR